MHVPLSVDLNADMGEGCDSDAALLRLVTSANVACGVHAGDPATSLRLARACQRSGVSFGAHPSGPPGKPGDFGRGPGDYSADEAFPWILHQIAAQHAIAEAAGIRLRHVKPHGTLYHLAGRGGAHGVALLHAIRLVDPKLVLFAGARSRLLEQARDARVRVVAEGFADRRYRADGSLVPRTEKNALLTRPAEAAAQAVALARGIPVPVAGGGTVRLGRVGTICIHGDSPHAVAVARAVRAALRRAKIRVAPP